jgi:hypothetical protein
MATDYTPRLPEIFPQGEIRVKDEDFSYDVTETSSGSFIEKTEYVLDKAPINAIDQVVGTVNGREYTFSPGEDYKLSDDKERIVWLSDSTERPDYETTFYVTYRCESIISRYIAPAVDQFETVDDELSAAIESKFIDTAEGSELDRIGELFGVLGKRRGRDDTQYRLFLKSAARSFVSRGTVSSIKMAVSAATDVPIEDITINENFENSTYELVVIPNTPVRSSVLDQITEIADPSGVEKSRSRFTLDDENVTIDDEVLRIKEGSARQLLEEVQQSDSVSVNQNVFSQQDDIGSQDSIDTITIQSVAWDDSDWDTSDWA